MLISFESYNDTWQATNCSFLCVLTNCECLYARIYEASYAMSSHDAVISIDTEAHVSDQLAKTRVGFFKNHMLIRSDSTR